LTKISFISFVLISLIAVFVFFLSNTRLLLNPFNITDISALHRIEAWAKSIQLIRSNPLVGIGTGSFKSIGQNLFPWIESGWQYPHNILLELFVENGVLGISLFLTFLFVIIKRYLKIREKVIGENRTILDTFFCLFLFTLINSMISGDLTMNANLWLFAGFIVSIGYNIEYYENETKGHIRSSYE
jgi:O-antigen ligase